MLWSNKKEHLSKKASNMRSENFELSAETKKQLEEARKTPRSEYISQKELEKEFLGKSIRYKGKVFNINIEEGEDGYLIAEVVGLPGCHTQAKSYGELLKRTKEAISLYLKCQKEPLNFPDKF